MASNVLMSDSVGSFWMIGLQSLRIFRDCRALGSSQPRSDEVEALGLNIARFVLPSKQPRVGQQKGKWGPLPDFAFVPSVDGFELACHADEKDLMRASVLGQVTDDEGPGEPNLEELDDREVDQLYLATRRKNP